MNGKCPICGKKLITKYEYGVEEWAYECGDHYSETFAYGTTQIQVGDFYTHINYDHTTEHKKELAKRIQMIANSYKL